MLKIRLLCQFLNEIHSILEPCTKIAHTLFWPRPPKTFWINFKLAWICINTLKIRAISLSFLRYNRFTNPAAWLAKSILAHIPRSIFFQIWDLYRNIVYKISFHYCPTSEKIMIKFFHNFKKPYFWPILLLWHVIGYWPSNKSTTSRKNWNSPSQP